MADTSMNGYGGPSPAAIDQGVHEAYEAAGYVQPDGSVDLPKLRQTILDIVREAKVLNKKERGEKAITRGTLMARLFPTVPGPEDWDGDLLQQRIYAELNKRVWGQVTPNANGPVQRLVGIEFGNGYVLCQTKIGKDQAPAVYVSDDFSCIDQDYVSPDNAKVERALRNATINREMLVLRQPQHAKKYVDGYRRTFQAVMENGNSQMVLALEAATATLHEDEEEEEQEQEQE